MEEPGSERAVRQLLHNTPRAFLVILFSATNALHNSFVIRPYARWKAVQQYNTEKHTLRNCNPLSGTVD